MKVTNGSHSFCFTVWARYEILPQSAITFGLAVTGPLVHKELYGKSFYTPRAQIEKEALSA